LILFIFEPFLKKYLRPTSFGEKNYETESFCKFLLKRKSEIFCQLQSKIKQIVKIMNPPITKTSGTPRQSLPQSTSSQSEQQSSLLLRPTLY